MPKINISSLLAPEIEMENHVSTIELGDQKSSEKPPGRKVNLEFIDHICMICIRS